MNRIYVPSKGADDWRQFLADPEKQWRTGYSARTLAYCWEAAQGLPAEIAGLFATIAADAELLLAMPEHKVPLPGARRGDSQNDLFALVKAGGRTFATMVEGKVDEPFGPLLGDWLVEASAGKRQRLAFISELLGLASPLPDDLHYQLLHRTASALIEAARFKTDAAAMIVHSFSPGRKWFDAFARLAALFGIGAEPRKLLLARGEPVPLYLGWAAGDERFITA